MATGTAEPRILPPPPPAPIESVERERVIRQQLSRTSLQVRLVDLASSVAVWIIAVLLLFITAAGIDHFIGLGAIGRFAALALLIGGSLWYLLLRVGPLLVRTINPAYAARTIEEATPSIKNSLINFLQLRQDRSGLKEIVYQAVEQQAATDIVTVPVEATVDRTRLIHAGYVLCGVMAVFAAYKILSPKDPFQTVARVLAPWADIARPSRVQISDVQPGNTEVYHGQVVHVSATIRGMRGEERVAVRYSTADGQTIDQAIAMKRTSGDRYECDVPPEAGGPAAAGGLLQNATYRIVAGDAESSAYRLTVISAPTIFVDRLEYQFPGYTRKAAESLTQQGDIKALEGTKVTINAVANQPIKSAWIEFDPTGEGAGEIIPLSAAGDRAQGTFTLLLKADRQTPWHGSYQVRFYNERNQRSQRPILHRIDVLRDLPPEVQILKPDRIRVEVPENGELPIEVRAVDPDFGLAGLRIEGEAAGKPQVKVNLLEDAAAHPAQANTTYLFRPREQNLSAGDELKYAAVAEDNRTSPQTGQPEPNVTRTKEYTLVVTAPQQNQSGQGGQDQRPQPGGQQQNQPKSDAAKADQQRPDQKQQDSDQNKQKDQPSEQKNPLSKNEDGKQGKEQQQSGKQNEQQKGQQQKEEQQDGQQQKGEQQKGDSKQGSDQQQTGQGQGDQQQGKQQSGEQQGQSGSQQQSSGESGGQQGQSGQGGRGGKSQQSQETNEQSGDAAGQGNTGQGNNRGQRGGQSKSDQNSSESSGDQKGAQAGKRGGSADDQGKAEHDGQVFERVLDDLTKRNQQGQPRSDQSQAAEKGQPNGDRQQERNADQQQKGTEKTQSGNEQASQPRTDGSSGAQVQNTPNTGAPEANDQKAEANKGDAQNAGKSGKAADRVDDKQLGQNPSEQPSDANKGGAPKGGSKTDKGEKSPPSKGEEHDPGSAKTGEEGAGQASQDKSASGEGNFKNSDRNKEQQPDNTTETTVDPSPQNGSTRQSDSKGGESGDRSGGGKQGAGQSAGQEGNDSAGTKSAGDQGTGKASETGGGETGDKAGGQQKATSKTGQKGDETGEGTGARAGKTAPGAGEQGKGENSQQSGASGQGSAGDVPRGGEDDGQQRFQNAKEGGEDQAADAANLEYARKATEMVLNRLKDQEHNPDPDLLDKLGWTREDLAEFLRRWESLQKTADESPTGKRELDEALKSLGLRDPNSRKRAGGKVTDDQRGLRDAGNRSAPPPRYRELFDSFRKAAARSQP